MMTLQALFGIELPIIQAPMAGVQGSALAISVSNAGGLGSLPCALLNPTSMREELARIKSQTTRPYVGNSVPWHPVSCFMNLTDRRIEKYLEDILDDH